jgi:phospholipase/carboxylesterase
MTHPHDPHRGAQILASGAPLKEARAALVLIHGRGASAESIMELAPEVGADGFDYLAPQAAGFAWYPESFIAPVARNEPYLTSALGLLDSLFDQVAGAGVPAERTVLLGFSQGACLALEYAARRPRRYGGLVALSGGLIENGDKPRTYEGDLAGTPTFLGCSDVDFHIPVERVRRSTTLLRGLGADVTERIYPGMGHTVNADELEQVQAMLRAVLG